MMRRIFGSRGLKCWSPLSPFRNLCGVHPTDVEDDCWTVNFQAQYHIQSKDVRKMHRAASKGKVARVQHILFMGENGLNETDKKEGQEARRAWEEEVGRPGKALTFRAHLGSRAS